MCASSPANPPMLCLWPYDGRETLKLLPHANCKDRSCPFSTSNQSTNPNLTVPGNQVVRNVSAWLAYPNEVRVYSVSGLYLSLVLFHWPFLERFWNVP